MATRLSLTSGPAARTTLLCVALLLAFSGGAVAKATYDATNADKVDGKHAVSSTKNPAKRKGRLVATDSSGRLPDNIIKQAPDAARLGGVSADALKVLTFPATSAGASGSGATIFTDEANLNQATEGTVSWQFMLPPDRDVADPILATIVYQDGSTAACSWHATGAGSTEYVDDDKFYNAGWSLPGVTAYTGPISVPATPGNAQRATFTLATPQQPAGSLVSFTLTRKPTEAADNCDFGIRIKALQVQY